MRTFLLLSAGVLVMSACATSGAPGTGGSSDRGGFLGSVGNVFGGNQIDGQITQCYSEGGTEAVIDYPDGWSRRVSRAETEDELLGGAGQTVASSGELEIETGVAFTYPAAALSPPIEGICEIKLNVSRRGEPSNVAAACSDPLFVAEAERAVSNARFKPMRVNGTVVRGINATYPMKFCLGDN